MAGISWPSRPPEHLIVTIHGAFSGLADSAGESVKERTLRQVT